MLHPQMGKSVAVAYYSFGSLAVLEYGFLFQWRCFQGGYSISEKGSFGMLDEKSDMEYFYVVYIRKKAVNPIGEE